MLAALPLRGVADMTQAAASWRREIASGIHVDETLQAALVVIVSSDGRYRYDGNDMASWMRKVRSSIPQV